MWFKVCVVRGAKSLTNEEKEKMKMIVYRRNVDEETGEWELAKLGEVSADDKEGCITSAIETFGANHGPGWFNNTRKGDLRLFFTESTPDLTGRLEADEARDYRRLWNQEQPSWNQ
jgi:hypothetical protein